LLVLLFATSGVLHFIFLDAYASTVPAWLPAHTTLVAISGVAELLGAFGVLYLPLRKFAGIGLLLLCVAVWPANLQMLLDAHRHGAARGWQILLALRLPLQIPLMFWIWHATLRRRPLH
jgi:uncharacterized membrane protein